MRPELSLGTILALIALRMVTTCVMAHNRDGLHAREIVRYRTGVACTMIYGKNSYMVHRYFAIQYHPPVFP
jgi:hypothetical protein